MGNHLFTQDGTSVDTLAKESKAAAKTQSLKLKDARDTAAAKHGFSSWQMMIENAVEFGPEEFDDDVIYIRKGPDRMVINLDAFYNDETYYDAPSNNLKPLLAVKDLHFNEWGSVLYDIRFEVSEEGDASHGEGSFCREDFVIAMIDAEEGEYEAVIELLHDAGLFNGLDEVPVRDGEHEAYMELSARTFGRSVKDRILFNLSSPDHEHVVLDFTKRCFANLLDNGDVMICNGGSSAEKDFLWKMLPRAEFETLARDMHEEHGPEAHFNGHGEIWMHDQVLSEMKASAEPELRM